MADKFVVRSMFDEFPFLRRMDIGYRLHPELLTPEKIDYVRVARVSIELLESRPMIVFANLVYEHDDTRIFLLNQEGQILLEVEQSTDDSTNERFEWELCTRETVGESLLRIKNPEDVKYILSYRQHHDKTVVVIYKPPKRFTLMEWLAEERRRATEQVVAMIEAVDTEG